MRMIAFIIALLGISATVVIDRKDGFIIYGKLKGLKDGTHLYLIHKNKGSDTVATTIAKNESFSFHGKLSNEVEAYFIKIDTVQTKYSPAVKGYITLILENSIIHLTGSIKDLSLGSIKVEGSISHKDYKDYRNLAEAFNKKSNDLEELKSKIAARTSDTISLKVISETQKQEFESFLTALKTWIYENSTSLMVPWIIQTNFSNIDYLDSAYNHLSVRAQNAKYGVDLKRELDMFKNTAIGNIAPDIRLESIDGSRLKLSDVVKVSKATLLSFWASWCKPCREEFPDLKTLYTRYHEQGFNIFAVSIDNSFPAWKKAVAQEKLPWYNVCEVDKVVSKGYGVEAIPQIFLLDSKGRIIAKEFSSLEELEQKIEELLEMKG